MNTQQAIKYIEHWNLRKLTKLITLLAVVIGLVTSWFWYQSIYMTNERRFWAAINNSMSTQSVVRTLTDGGTGNEVTQDFRFHFSPQKAIENRILLTERNATTDTKIETEGIVTPFDQFLRYSSFSSLDQGDLLAEDGSSLVGKWASGGETQPTEDIAKLNFVSEQVSLVIFGNFSATFRNSALQDMKDNAVYGDSLNTAKEGELDGRKTLEYGISVSLPDYVRLLQDSFHESGLGDFPPLAPENYREGSRVNGVVVIDKGTNEILVVGFGGRTEEYGNYGVVKNIENPIPVMTIDELQSQVQSSIQLGS
ncbi:MAG: hypothetical protein ACI9T8_000453 [Candidatus Saccharimonadales bacterium]|jgi:hypothetical protein